MAQESTKIELEERKAHFVETALNIGFDAKITEICEKSGVPRRTFYNWLDDDMEFKNVWNNLWKRELSIGWPDSARALMKQARRGDVSAIKLHAQLIGIHTEKKEHDINEKVIFLNELLLED